MKALWRRRNAWIAVGLLVANGLGWLTAASSISWPAAEPRLHPEIAAVREQVLSEEDLRGEPFALTIDEQAAAEAIAWFLERNPRVPFSHPLVEFDPAGVTGRGLAYVAGLRVPVYGRATIGLRDGVPQVRLQELGVAGLAVPGFVREVIQDEVEAQFDFSQRRLPVEMTVLRLEEGVMRVEGVYR